MVEVIPVASAVPPHEAPKPGRIDALDGLRAVAAFMVLTTHVAFHTGLVIHPVVGPILSRLDFGVCLFFLLSGFLLYGPWARAAMTSQAPPSVRRYARSRFARVYPAYFVLIVVVLGWFVAGAPAPWQVWATFLTMTQIYVPDIEVASLNQTWSVATEVAFYALLPVLGWLAGRRHAGDADRSTSRQLRMLMAMGLIAFVFLTIRSWTDWLPAWQSSFWLTSYLDWFALGMLLAVVRARRSLPGVPTSRLVRSIDAVGSETGASLTAAALLFALATTPLAGKYFFDGTFGPDTAGVWSILAKHYLYGAAAFFMLLPLVLGRPTTWYARALSAPVMRALGTVSYGVFLWHLLVVYELAELLGLGTFRGGFLVLWPATVGVTLVIAALSWRLLERPILERAHRRRTPRTPAPQAPSPDPG